jgi:hypothetical protein
MECHAADTNHRNYNHNLFAKENLKTCIISLAIGPSPMITKTGGLLT